MSFPGFEIKWYIRKKTNVFYALLSLTFFFFSPFFSDAWEFQISFVVPDSEAYVQYLQQQYKLCCTSANMAVLGHWGIYHYCVRYWSGSLLLQEESKLVAAVLWSFLLVIQLTPFDTQLNVVKQKPDYD